MKNVTVILLSIIILMSCGNHNVKLISDETIFFRDSATLIDITSDYKSTEIKLHYVTDSMRLDFIKNYSCEDEFDKRIPCFVECRLKVYEINEVKVRNKKMIYEKRTDTVKVSDIR